MWNPRRSMDIRFPLFCLLIAADLSFVNSLRDMEVKIPTAVRRGESATLQCIYNMEGDSLYSIKWYKGKREFYRYTPKETPSMKIFPVAGINVEMSLSNASQVIVSQVETSISGKFSCEVSADAPTFHTMLVSSDMEIVDIPTDGKPLIDGLLSRYKIGDPVSANCTSEFSKPAANVSWLINDAPASPAQLILYKLPKNDSNLESTILGINFPITQQHFVRGKLKLKCTAKIYELYLQSTERLIEEIRPKILATGTSNVNLYHNPIYDGELNEQNEIMTHYKADMSSSTPSKSLMYSYLTICWITFYICTICTILFYSLRVGIS
ncbi:unnamed protein product [Diamesa hyperborea]